MLGKFALDAPQEEHFPTRGAEMLRALEIKSVLKGGTERKKYSHINVIVSVPEVSGYVISGSNVNTVEGYKLYCMWSRPVN